MDLLLIAVVSEAYKGELVAHKGLWYWKGLLLSPIFLNVIKITGVNVTAQFRHYRGSRCTWRWKIHDDAGITEPLHYIYNRCMLPNQNSKQVSHVYVIDRLTDEYNNIQA